MIDTARQQTPIRRQYLHIKSQYPDAILFFRLGDFYETFDGDAELVANLLDIVLTSREMGKGQRVPMAGIPYHAAEGHLARLVAAGHRVAICEQVGAPTGRDLVHREVVRVVTPGTTTEPNLLDPVDNCYLGAVLVEPAGAGLAYADLSTGEFVTMQLPPGDLHGALAQELLRLRPREVLTPTPAEPGADDATPGWLPEAARRTPLDRRLWRLETARAALLDHFDAASLDGFGCAGLPLATRAAGALLQYASDTQKGMLAQLCPLETRALGEAMALDAHTIRNLELAESGRGNRRHSLVAVLDHTRTPMGARLLRRWVATPLTRLEPLAARQAAVACLVEEPLARADIRAILGGVGDLERLSRRAVQGTIQPRELRALAASARQVGRLRAFLRDLLGASDAATGDDRLALRPCLDRLHDHDAVADLIEQALVDDPPATLGQTSTTAMSATIRPGFAPELDGLRNSIQGSRSWLASLEARERQRTGIRGLKVSYNKVFGYYIEVSRANSESGPEDYIRKQTLVGAERYITPELKEHEARMLSADEQIRALEGTVYRQVVQQVAAGVPGLTATSQALAEIDALAALAEAATRRRYVRPTLTADNLLHIRGGRHPVVETTLEDEAFVPNDARLDRESRQIVILTGPNMSGKSTYLRMVGLIALMAQIGSFVPAEEAVVGLMDRIFTRVGAQDDIASGQSTFMVEMVETAAILNHATPRSLVILDEIGRGTSTYDGLAIARAVVEHLHHAPRLGCRTVFATHYHELTELADLLPRVVNAKMDVLEEGQRVVFLRRVVDGGADRSYGLHVAQLAGIPRGVIRRATEILRDLEAKPGEDRTGRGRIRADSGDGGAPTFQLSFLTEPHPAVRALRDLDVDALSPLEAMTRLYELQRMVREADGNRDNRQPG